MSKSKKDSKVGRPTDYDPDKMIPEMLEMAKDGKTVVSMCAHWGISRVTFYDWCKKYKEFSYTYKKARPLIENWWIQKGHDMMMMPSKDTNATMYIWMTRNLLDWRDKVELSEPTEADELEFV